MTEDIKKSIEDLPVEQFAKTLKGVNPNKVKDDLAELGYLRRTQAGYRVYVKHKSLFIRKLMGCGLRQGIFPTEEGVNLLKQLHKEKKLTTKLAN